MSEIIYKDIESVITVLNIAKSLAISVISRNECLKEIEKGFKAIEKIRKELKLADDSIYSNNKKKESKKRIRITHCYANGIAFSNAKDNSEHTLINTPIGAKESEFWINGIGEPVRLMRNEFEFIK